MEIKQIAITDLRPYKNNPRHNDNAVDAVMASIKEFGFKIPLVIDKNYEIIAGHTRIKAAVKMGLTEVPCIIADDLTPKQIRAFRLADNKTAELADWNIDLLNMELSAIDDIDMTAFGFELNDTVEPFEDDYDADAILNNSEPPICKIGDIWQLGRHRLMCCDNTSQKDIAKLMDGATASLWITDPPYNADYEGKTDAKLKMKNDNLTPEKFQEFLTKSFNNAVQYLKLGAAFYIWHGDCIYYQTYNALQSAGLKIHQLLIWAKNTFTLCHKDYQYQHEPCLYGWKEGTKHYYTRSRQFGTVLDFDKPARNAEHPTMKPIKLISQLINNSSHEGDTVIDFFGGSGSMLISCEMLNRTCYTAELDPRYCDVIIDRWEILTGKKAVLLNG